VICPRPLAVVVPTLSRLRSLVSSFLKGSERLSGVPKECVSIQAANEGICIYIRGNSKEGGAASETRDDEDEQALLKEGKERTVSDWHSSKTLRILA
jgi:hypothetical protein